LNVDILEEAFRTLVERHESLRSTFLLVDGELRQKVNPDVSFKIERADISDREDKEGLAFQLAAQEASEPFNFEECPLMRVKLIKLEEDRYLFLYTVHHIISDGWSMNVLVNEIFTLYGAYSRGEGNPLKPLRVQYKDYVAWQKEQLSGEQLEEHRRYWLTKLSGDLPVLNLQTDRPRPQMQSFGGDQYAFRIGPELTEGLYEVIREQGASLFMGLLAALYALLHRYTSQTDIIIGTPIAGRSHSDLEDQIGYYLNNLALRTEVRGEDSFRELLDRVKETTLGAYEHQVFPFDWLIRELNVKRDPSRAPLVDVGLTLQNQNASEPGSRNRDGSAAPARDIAILPFEQEHKISRNDLWFYCNEFGEEIFTSVNYNTALFTAESIELMAARLVKLISQVVADPEIRIMDIELATEDAETPESEAGDTELDFELNL
jgi:Condensation domain